MRLSEKGWIPPAAGQALLEAWRLQSRLAQVIALGASTPFDAAQARPPFQGEARGGCGIAELRGAGAGSSGGAGGGARCEPRGARLKAQAASAIGGNSDRAPATGSVSMTIVPTPSLVRIMNVPPCRTRLVRARDGEAEAGALEAILDDGAVLLEGTPDLLEIPGADAAAVVLEEELDRIADATRPEAGAAVLGVNFDGVCREGRRSSG